MDKEQAITILQSHQGELHRRGVLHAGLFGSVARGDAGPTSDLDIMIDLEPEAPIDVFGYAALKRYIAGLFPGRVDVVNREALKPRLRGSVASDEIPAF